MYGTKSRLSYLAFPCEAVYDSLMWLKQKQNNVNEVDHLLFLKTKNVYHSCFISISCVDQQQV